MAELLYGAPAAAALDAETAARSTELRELGIVPTLAIVRLGERADDIWYENAAKKRCAKVGVETVCVTMPRETDEDVLLEVIASLNEDASVHGVLVFLPLPRHIDTEKVREKLLPAKDVDGITYGSQSSVYSGKGVGFAPCTAEACIRLLDHYGVEIAGKRAAVIGRSTVIGKPAAMLLLGRNATVTVCHSKTQELESAVREADILISAAGKIGVVGAGAFRPGQTVLDVGMNAAEDGTMHGDLPFEEASNVVDAITPVPGGVGAVTTSVLAAHTVCAAMQQ